MDGRNYSVRIEPQGRLLTVAAGQPVLEAALDAGLNLPHSCKTGHCSACRALLRSGQVRYPGGRPLGVSAEEEGRGYVLLCQSLPLSDLTVEARVVASVADVEIKTLPCRVVTIEYPAPDVARVLLQLPAVEPLRFRPGQYLDVLLEDHRRRSFSIASPPHDAQPLELHLRAASGSGFTQRFFLPAQDPAAIRPGNLLRIEGPLGQLVYEDASRPALLVAGGTGFAPLKSMLRHALERGSVRPLHLFWGAREARDLYEDAQVLEWTRRHPTLRYTAALSEARSPHAPHQVLGLVHEVVLHQYSSLAEVEVYAAGPPAMIDAIRREFPAHGLPEDRLHFDSFDYATR